MISDPMSCGMGYPCFRGAWLGLLALVFAIHLGGRFFPQPGRPAFRGASESWHGASDAELCGRR